MLIKYQNVDRKIFLSIVHISFLLQPITICVRSKSDVMRLQQNISIACDLTRPSWFPALKYPFEYIILERFKFLHFSMFSSHSACSLHHHIGLQFLIVNLNSKLYSLLHAAGLGVCRSNMCSSKLIFNCVAINYTFIWT